MTPNPSRQEEVETELDKAMEWANMAAKKPELYDDCLGRALISLAAEVSRLQKELSATSEASAQHCADAVRLAFESAIKSIGGMYTSPNTEWRAGYNAAKEDAIMNIKNESKAAALREKNG